MTALGTRPAEQNAAENDIPPFTESTDCEKIIRQSREILGREFKTYKLISIIMLIHEIYNSPLHSL